MRISSKLFIGVGFLNSRNTFGKIMDTQTNICTKLTTLFNRDIIINSSSFIKNIFEAYDPGFVPCSDNLKGNITIINFKDLEKQNWGNSDFLAISENSEFVLLSNLEKIDLTDRNLARRFILFIGIFVNFHR